MILKPGGVKTHQNYTQHIKVCIPLKAYYSRSQFKSIFGLGHLQFETDLTFTNMKESNLY